MVWALAVLSTVDIVFVPAVEPVSCAEADSAAVLVVSSAPVVLDASLAVKTLSVGRATPRVGLVAAVELVVVCPPPSTASDPAVTTAL